MKILECTDSFLPVTDGVGRVVEHYARLLGERGHEVTVCCPMKDTGIRAGLPYEIVDFLAEMSVPGSPQYKAGVAGLDPHFVRRMEHIPLDIVHVHSPATAGWEGVHIARKRGIPLVGTFHSKFYEDVYNMTHSRTIASLGASVIAEFFSICDETWTVSGNAAEELRSYGYKGRIRIVRNGTDLHPGEPVSRQETERFLGIGEEPLLLYVGQIDRKKNIGLTLEACALLKSRGVPFRLALVGKGRDEERFRTRVRELELTDRVIFTGHIGDFSLLSGIYARAGLFCFPSNYDTAGLVVCEAAAMNTPSVTLLGSAPAEIITDNENGILCTESAVSLANAIERALAQPEKLAEMGRRAAKELPVGWDTVMDEAERRYSELIADGAAPRPLFRFGEEQS